MLTHVSQSSLCVDVFRDGDHIGELCNNGLGYWTFCMGSRGSRHLQGDELRQMADVLDKLNKGIK